MLENKIYSDRFNFIGAFINEREKIIEDGFPDQLDSDNNMTTKGKLERCS